ncbi:MAG: desulfoferrodoxin FeS4 iron-binding domain-containing protein [Mailhella sp.]|nr:desulfoferrodoxin FeS4 iron-binding domain-containing protein [Mailhella sp.]
MEMRFYQCALCGQIAAIVKKTGSPLVCCGQPMKEMVPGTTDASQEKHVPVYSVSGTTVSVKIGAAEHPMTEAHYIEWVSLRTEKGNQRKALAPGDAPFVTFAIEEGDAVKEVYAYCNLHGLWKA